VATDTLVFNFHHRQIPPFMRGLNQTALMESPGAAA
jgi:hypothetical protein